MTFSDFLTKWNNKFCEVVDPTSLNQCFDLVVAWTDALGIPRVFPFQYAYQIYSNFGPTQAQYFDRIFNGPDDVPKEGDIIVWSYYYNYGAGHTGVCKSADLYTLNVFEQNDPLGTNCHLRAYGYSNILGWLRPKVYNQPPTYPHEDLAKKAIQTALNETMTASQAGDPKFKENMAIVKSQALQIVNML